MHLYITSAREDSLEAWRSVIPASERIEYVRSLPRAIQADAICMSGIYALERYGGAPRHDIAQILDNLRNDGMPPMIVVPPSLPMRRTSSGTLEVIPELRTESPAHYAVSRALQAIDRWNESSITRKIDTLIFDLPLLGMDDPEDRSTPKSTRKAMSEHLKFL
ncbi:hypothetical protein GCM10010094_79980 [Streptomyces flaveus]|uniref:Uncharacterized protein n=2 Tax=Streptomyces flaveus TaxID=66370 RepID=A0A917RI78_9ACTN|nr:hypothetical protein GCM10010094_79980 [Streptomyces flaveus]